MSRRANGEGTIYLRRDGRYEGAAFVPTSSGTSKRIRVYAGTREEARKKLTALQRQADQGIPVAAELWSLHRYLKYWLDEVVKPQQRPKTYQGYASVVHNHLVPGLGKKRLDRLTAKDVRQFIKGLSEGCHCCRAGLDAGRGQCCSIGQCCGRRLSRRTVQQAHSVLRNALHSAMREELIFRNVASLVRVPAPAYRVDRGLSVEQAHKLIELSEPDRLHAFFVLAVMLGLRRGELLGLHWSDVDLNGGALRVVHTLQRVGGRLQLVPPKTMSSVRTVPLPETCVAALRRHADRQEKERVEAAEAWQDSGLVFTSRVGTPLEPDNLRRHWEPLKTALGVELRFHDLRHTCVSLLLDLGVPPHVVREIVGHADIGVTMQIYAHASLDERRRAMDALDGRLR
jgi:integrase